MSLVIYFNVIIVRACRKRYERVSRVVLYVCTILYKCNFFIFMCVYAVNKVNQSIICRYIEYYTKVYAYTGQLQCDIVV